MKKLWITGGNGQLGRALGRLCTNQEEYQLYMTDMEVDITDSAAVLAYAQEVQPYAIINCAAMTAVDACETKEDMAYRVNAEGPRNLALAAKETSAKLVQISTDYVFAGDGTRPYTEEDSPAPISAYGRTKLAGEQLVEACCDKYFLVRTAWLYGDGKNFVRTMLRVARDHEEVTVVDDQVGNPTSALELARAVLALIETDSYGIYHATCEGVTSWADFTEEFYRLAGVTTRVRHISSEEYSQMHPESANRPHYSVLSKDKLRDSGIYTMCDWKIAIREYMQEELSAKGQ